MLRIIIVLYSNGIALRIINETGPYFAHIGSYSVKGRNKAEEVAKTVANALRVIGFESTIETLTNREFDQKIKFMPTWEETQ